MNLQDQSKILVNMINDRKAKTVVEIGVHRGGTAKGVYDFCPSITEYIMVDPWKVYTCTGSGTLKRVTQDTWDGFYIEVVNKFSSIDHFQVLRMPSLEGAKQFSNNYFDIVFIDAIHSKVEVIADIKAWLPKVKKGGLLMGDDIHQPEVLYGVREYLGDKFYKLPKKGKFKRVWAYEVV